MVPGHVTSSGFGDGAALHSMWELIAVAQAVPSLADALEYWDSLLTLVPLPSTKAGLWAGSQFSSSAELVLGLAGAGSLDGGLDGTSK